MPEPCISVGSEEVPLTHYFQAVDLWAEGHTPSSIVARIGIAEGASLMYDTAVNIVYNQELIRQSAKQLSFRPTTISGVDSLKSRIYSVFDLDDLNIVSMVAKKKEKENLDLKQSIARLT